MNNSNAVVTLIQVVTLFAALVGLVTQFLASDQIKNFFQIETVNGAYYLNVFSFGGLVLGIVIILILLAFRSKLTKRFYFNFKEGQKYLHSQSLRENKTKDLEELSKNSKYSVEVLEPRYYTIQRLGIFAYIISLIDFTLIFVTNNELSKSILYFVFILLFVFTITVFFLDLYNSIQKKHREERAEQFIKEKIERYLLPKITYKGELKTNPGYPSTSYIDFEVLESNDSKKFRVVVNSENPEKYFEILNR